LAKEKDSATAGAVDIMIHYGLMKHELWPNSIKEILKAGNMGTTGTSKWCITSRHGRCNINKSNVSLPWLQVEATAMRCCPEEHV
jgi:hypothetical protein